MQSRKPLPFGIQKKVSLQVVENVLFGLADKDDITYSQGLYNPALRSYEIDFMGI